jgi:Family of unknown function (DUF6301)
MTEPVMLTDLQIADAVSRMARVSWSWSAEDAQRLAAQLGWPVDSQPPSRYLFLRTGYPTGRGRASVNLYDRSWEDIHLPVTDSISDWGFPRQADLFANAVGVASGVLGEPPYREPGKRSEVSWPTGGGVLAVRDYGEGLFLILRSARHAAWLQAERDRKEERRLTGVGVVDQPPRPAVPASTRWEEVAAALAAAMSRFERDTLLSLVDPADRDGRYLQMWQNPDALWVEVSSSRILGAKMGVPPEVERRIGELGWTPPLGRDNWRRSLPWPARAAAYVELAGSIVAVWRDVFGIDSPQQVGYRAAVTRTRELIAVPELGLRRVR